jgi:histidinol-phosphate/aromatic aminotransferase/cobyric acid decarboxylase-like protein
MAAGLGSLPGLRPLPSAANYLLVRGEETGEGPRSLEPLRLALERRHRILLRDCRSFEGLGPGWLRIALQGRRANRRLLAAMRRQASAPG